MITFFLFSFVPAFVTFGFACAVIGIILWVIICAVELIIYGRRNSIRR